MKMNLTLGKTAQKYVLWSFIVSHYHETSAPFISLSWIEGMQVIEEFNIFYPDNN